MKNGVDQAAADLGITVNYHAPETFDMVAMAQLIDTAVAAEPDGIVISNPDPTRWVTPSRAPSTPASRW